MLAQLIKPSWENKAAHYVSLHCLLRQELASDANQMSLRQAKHYMVGLWQMPKLHTQSLSRIPLFVTPWTVAHQAPLSMGLPQQEYWNGLPFPPPGDLPHPRIEPGASYIGRWILYHWATWETSKCQRQVEIPIQQWAPVRSVGTRIGFPTYVSFIPWQLVPEQPGLYWVTWPLWATHSCRFDGLHGLTLLGFYSHPGGHFESLCDESGLDHGKSGSYFENQGIGIQERKK